MEDREAVEFDQDRGSTHEEEAEDQCRLLPEVRGSGLEPPELGEAVVGVAVEEGATPRVERAVPAEHPGLDDCEEEDDEGHVEHLEPPTPGYEACEVHPRDAHGGEGSEYRQELNQCPPLPPAVELPLELAVPALGSVSPGAEAVRVYGIQSADTSEG